MGGSRAKFSPAFRLGAYVYLGIPLDKRNVKNAYGRLKAADAIIAKFKEEYPEKATAHPDKLFPGFEMLDQFWFAEYKGIGGIGI